MANSANELATVNDRTGDTGLNFGNFWQVLSDKIEGGKESPVTILGKVYESKEEYEQEIRSKIWLTYRYGFEAIEKAEDGPNPMKFMHSYLFNKNLWLSTIQNMHLPEIMDGDKFTSDVGWGCMIRTSQSLLANALMKVELDQYNNDSSKAKDKQILKKQSQLDDTLCEQNQEDSKNNPPISSKKVLDNQKNNLHSNTDLKEEAIDLNDTFDTLEDSSDVSKTSTTQPQPKIDLKEDTLCEMEPQTSIDPSRTIIDQFQDHSGSTFSLHNFIQVASELPLQVRPGEWFGPNAASLSIKRLCDKMDFQPKIKVLLSESGDLYDDKIAKTFETNTDIKGLLVLFPVRLGIDKVNAYYNSSLQHLLSITQSVGIAGGKPSSSFYFVGFQDNNMIYLNPHFPQAIATPTDYLSYHSHTYQKLEISNLDPSMMVGVVLQDMEDYQRFKASCVSSANKIVHFHPSEKKLSQRKNSEFVHVEHNDLLKSDAFVNIDEDGDDDYVDLGADFEECDVNADSQNACITANSVNESTEELVNITESTVTTSTEEILNITDSNLEMFETIPKLLPIKLDLAGQANDLHPSFL